MPDITQATNAYSATLNNLKSAAPTDTGDAGAFGDLVKAGMNSAIDAQHHGEKISGLALAGKADMTDVLQALNNAEMALNTVLALRDKVVQAYNDVMRTQI